MNIYFAYQLANALQYLTEFNFIHCDLGTRNCLFYSDYTIKLTDCAMALQQYEHEYWLANNGQRIPLRWIAPEVLTVSKKMDFGEEKKILMNLFLDKSDDEI
jgi:serine/threonine protein kinase